MTAPADGLEEALAALLLANDPLHELVGDRITWMKRAQGAGLPAGVLNRIAGEGALDHMRGHTTVQRALIQADWYGATYAAAKTAARACRAVLAAPSDARFTGLFVQAERDFVEPAAGGQPDVFRTSLDVEVWFQPA